MRIAILVPLFPPHWLGGAEVAAYYTAKHLAKRHEVHIITSRDKGLPRVSVNQEAFYVHRVNTIKKPWLLSLTYNIAAFWQLRKIKPDVVHVQSIFSGLAAYLGKKLLSTLYVVFCRGSDIYLPWPFKKPISNLIVRNADAVVALSSDMKRQIAEVTNTQSVVIPNGIEVERFEGLSPEKAKEELGIKNNEKVILFVGSLRPIKGTRYLIQAMLMIKQQEPNARLLIVGDGPDRQSLENLVRKLDLQQSIDFVGRLPQERIPHYMSACDIFTLPSLSEGFGLACLEAVSSGLPVVATGVGGLPDLIEDGKNGFLIPARNVAELARKLVTLLESDELRQEISKNNREKAQKYDWSIVSHRIEEVYESVLESKNYHQNIREAPLS